MSEVLSIREVGAEAAETLALLFSEFNSILGADSLPEHKAFLPQNVHVSPEQMAGRLNRMAPVEKVLIAHFANEPAGLACLRLVPYIGQEGPFAELTQLYVRERFQRRGVGAALIVAAERLALESEATCVHIVTGADNLNAQAFYRAQGYAMPGVEFEKHFASERQAVDA